MSFVFRYERGEFAKDERHSPYRNPSPGRILIQRRPPKNVTDAAVPNAQDHPNCSASQGVRVGDRVPPRLPPVFMRPDKVPAWGLERSTVELQNAPTVRYNQPAPKDRNRMATIGAETLAPTTIDREANPIPSRLLKKACVGDARREQGAKSGLLPLRGVIGPILWGRPRGVSPWESRVLGFFNTMLDPPQRHALD